MFEDKLVKAEYFTKVIDHKTRAMVDLLANRGIVPNLSIILTNNNKASLLYVERKKQKAQALGIKINVIMMSHNICDKELCAQINKLNLDNKVTAFMIQLPLADQLNLSCVGSINQLKDADGLSFMNMGRLFYLKGNNDCLLAATAVACHYVIDHLCDGHLRGVKICLIGTSLIVGFPLLHMLINRNAIVFPINNNTSEHIMDYYLSQADIVVSAVGKRHFLHGSKLKIGSKVLDVGISYHNNKIYGDIDFDSAIKTVSAITPVPGGIGPITVSTLMHNTVRACFMFHSIPVPKQLLI